MEPLDENLLSEQMAAYLAGELPAPEREKMRLLLAAHPEYRQLYQQMLTVWQQKTTHQFDSRQAFAKLAQRINATELPWAQPGESARIRTLNRPVVWLWAATIAFLVVATAFFVGYKNTFRPESQPLAQENLMEKVIPAGKKSFLILPDGSKVWLNADSKLKYPVAFSGKIREVFLDGEAFFDVVKNPAQPFVIQTSQARIQVLGTSFDVKAYPDSKTVETMVVSGKVKISERANLENFVFLRPDEKGVYTAANRKISKSAVVRPEEKLEYVDWKKGTLALYDESMAEVATKLERWYGVTVEMDADKLQNCRVTAHFENQPIEKVLEYIKMVTPLEYAYQGNTIILTGTGCE